MKPLFCLVIAILLLPQIAQAQDELPTIYVKGDRAPDEPGSVAFVDSEDIDRIAADHPAEILNTLPGVNVQMNSGQENLIAIRSPVLTGGAGAGSFLLLENGLPTRAAAFGNVNALFELHHEVAETIEVVRGPASARYGSNAVHGLVNVILPKTGQPTGVDARASYSTLNRYRGDLIIGDDLGDWSGTAAVSLQEEIGWRDNTGLQQQKASASLARELAGWAVTARFAATNLNQETAGFIEGFKAYRDRDIASTNSNPEAYRDASTARASLSFDRQSGDTSSSITPYALIQNMRFRLHFLPYPAFETNDHSAGGVIADLEHDFGAFTMRGGAQVEYANGSLLEVQDGQFGFFPGDRRFPEGVHYDYSVDTSLYALWAEAEVELADNVVLLAGLRGETHEYDYTTATPAGTFGRFRVPADRTDTFDLLTPKLGIIWTGAFDSDVTLFANYARGERAPQASDLYRQQSQQTDGGLETETLDSFEIGARGGWEDLGFDIAAYIAEKTNFFFRDADGLNVTNGKTRHQGVEAAFIYDISYELDLSGTLSWSDQTYRFDRPANGIVSGNEIDTAPEWLGGVSLDWRATDAIEASISADYVGKYFTDEANTASYPGHTVFHARAAYAFGYNELSVRVRNLFDLKYADRADFAFGDDRYFPGEPLNVTLAIRRRW